MGTIIEISGGGVVGSFPPLGGGLKIDGGTVVIDAKTDLFSIVANQLTIKGLAIGEGLLANYAISTRCLQDAAVATNKIALGAVNTARLADGAVDTDKLNDLAVEASKLANSSVTATKIANLAVGSAAIAALAVGTGHIQNAAITNAKIGALAVGAANIQDAAVGTAQIGNAAIVTALIADAAVATAKIADLAVVRGKIANAAIGTAQIEDLAVTGAKIANATIDTANIKDAAITSAKIGSLTVSLIQSAIAGQNINIGSGITFTADTALTVDIGSSGVEVAGAGYSMELHANGLFGSGGGQSFGISPAGLSYKGTTIINYNGYGDFPSLKVSGADVASQNWVNAWAGSANITTIGTLSAGTVPWGRLSSVPPTFTPAAHTHSTAESWLSTVLSGKADASHTQAISTITGLQTALDAKASAASLTSLSNEVHTNGGSWGVIDYMSSDGVTPKSAWVWRVGSD